MAAATYLTKQLFVFTDRRCGYILFLVSIFVIMARLRNMIEDSDSDEEYIPRRPRWIRERNDYFYN